MRPEEKRRRRLAAEYGEPWAPVRGGIRVALVYPNTYWVGMSNLGFQTLFHLLNRRDDVTCERAFLPDPEEREKADQEGGPCRTLESGSPLNTFDLLAFSVSFELDYLSLFRILADNGIPPFREQRRRGRDPQVWIGGVAVSLNPLPVSDLADVMVIGEAEDLLPDLLDALTRCRIRHEGSFERFCRDAAQMEGVFLPHAYRAHYDAAGRFAGMEAAPGVPARVQRRWIRDLDRIPTVSRILTPDTELNDMFLVEVDRGCGRHCRFCAAGYLYRPPRFRSLEAVLTSVRMGLVHTDRVGLVGTAVSDYPRMEELLRGIESLGARISISSLRADAVTPALVSALARSGHKTLTLAPEAGSPRLREVINKGLREEEILEAARLALSSGIPNLKLYFLVGIPFEEEDDLAALVDLVLRIKEIQVAEARPRGRIGTITVSLNCFVPKAHTPFQWAAMNKKGALSKKIGYIKGRLRKQGNVRVLHDLPKWAAVQGLLSRGDPRSARLLEAVAGKGGNWTQVLKEWGPELSEEPFRPRDRAEPLPWDVIESGCRKEYLFRELEKAASGRCTPSCPEDPECRRCGVCNGPETFPGDAV